MDSQPHVVWFCQIIQGICPSHCPSWMPFPTVISLERYLFTMRKQIFRDFEKEITLILQNQLFCLESKYFLLLEKKQAFILSEINFKAQMLLEQFCLFVLYL